MTLRLGKKRDNVSNRWISFLDLLPTFLDEESLFSIAVIVGRPIHLDMATNDKTRPSCIKVKVQVDLVEDLPSHVEIKVVNSNNNTSRIVSIKV